MFAVRLLVLASLAVATLSACYTYKQVDDSSDGSNPKTKLHPSAVAR